MKKTRIVIAMTLLATILMILGGVLLIPHAFAGKYPPYDSPPSLVTSSIVAPLSNGSLTNGINDWTTNDTFNPAKLGETFYAYVDVINVTELLGYQVGFTFNSTFLQITNVTDTGWLTAAGGSLLSSFGFGNHTGYTTGDFWAVGEILSSGPFVNGSGALIRVGFEISPSLSSTGIASMMHFNVTTGDYHELILTSSDGSDITPPLSQIHDGYIDVQSIVPEFTPVFFVVLLITATSAVVLVTKVEWPRKRKG